MIVKKVLTARRPTCALVATGDHGIASSDSRASYGISLSAATRASRTLPRWFLRQRKTDQAAEQLQADDSWRGIKDSYVFTTGWGEPIHPIPSHR
jgi:hypothetical protein